MEKEPDVIPGEITKDARRSRSTVTRDARLVRLVLSTARLSLGFVFDLMRLACI